MYRNNNLTSLLNRQIIAVSRRGNQEVNEEYEYYVPVEYEKPSPNESRDDRQRYIIAKYVDKKFTQDKAPLTERGQPMRMPARQKTFREVNQNSQNIQVR